MSMKIDESADERARLLRRLAPYLAGPFFGLTSFIIANGGILITNKSMVALIWSLIAYTLAEHVVRVLEELRKETASSEVIEIMDDKSLQIITSIQTSASTINKSIERTADSFRAEVQLHLSVSHVRDADAHKKIGASLKTAYHVKNTFLGIKDLTGIRSASHINIMEHYREVLQKGPDANWYDIVGVGEILDGRIDELRRELSGCVHGSHEIYILTTQVPVINFILIGPKGGQFTEVYFGWIKNTAAEIDVFYSKDPKIIFMFNNYFESIRATRNRITHSKIRYDKIDSTITPVSVINRLRGTWISVSGSMKAVAPLGVTPDSAKQELLTYAIVRFEYDDDWHVHGDTYRIEDNKLLFSFDSELCFLSGNAMYYRYFNKNEFGRVESNGIGMYSLSSEGDILSGYYVRGNTNKSAALRGKKIHDGDVRDLAKLRGILEDIVKMNP